MQSSGQEPILLVIRVSLFHSILVHWEQTDFCQKKKDEYFLVCTCEYMLSWALCLDFLLLVTLSFSLPWPAFFLSCLVLRGAIERYMNWRLPRKGLGFVHLLRTHTHVFGHILKAIIFFPDMEVYKIFSDVITYMHMEHLPSLCIFL